MRRPILLTIFIVLGLSLSGCGPSKVAKDGSSDLSSRIDVGDENVDQGYLTECNYVFDESADLNIGLSTYYDTYTGAFIATKIRMTIDRLPAQLTTTSNVYIQMFKWREDRPGVRDVDSEPVGFYFQRRDGTILNEGSPYKAISKNTILDALSKASNSEQYSLINFFDHHIVILEGLDLIYDAISIATYDVGQGSEATHITDALLPAFSADPDIYDRNHPAPSLQSLHPFAEYAGAGLSENDFYMMAQDLCNDTLL